MVYTTCLRTVSIVYIQCWRTVSEPRSRPRRGVLRSENLLPRGSQSRDWPFSDPSAYVTIQLADAATGACGGYATGGRENDAGGRIREDFADKLIHKDGAGLPPQGRTVRAGVALPPGDARLLFPRPCGDS